MRVARVRFLLVPSRDALSQLAHCPLPIARISGCQLNYGTPGHVVKDVSQRTPGPKGKASAAAAQSPATGYRSPRTRPSKRVNGGKLSWLLRLLTVAALGVDVYVHASLAATYDPIRATFSQGQLFRVEAGAAAVGAVLILVWVSRVTWLFAVLVLFGGLAAVLFYQFVDPGPLGPLPNMHDPQWTTAKAASAIAEGIGAVTAAIGFIRALLAGP